MRFRRPKKQFHRSRRSSRQGESRMLTPRRSRPLTFAGVNTRPLKLYAVSQRRSATIKPRRESPNEQGRVMVYPIINRLPLLGLRSQQEIMGFGTGHIRKDIRAVKRQVRDISTTHSICHQRSDRRSVLFMKKIAGIGRKRSPGSGGTYKRTEDSQASCGRR